MHHALAVFVFSLAASVACAAPSLTPLPPTHPASPAAPEAVLAPASTALRQEPVAEEPEGGREAAPAPSGPHGAHHGH